MDPATIDRHRRWRSCAIFALDDPRGRQPRLRIILLPPLHAGVRRHVRRRRWPAACSSDATRSATWFKLALLRQGVDAGTTLVETIVELAERARREGLLALEDAVKTVEDPFLKRGLQLAIDGTDPEELRDILEAEIDAKRKAGTRPARSSSTDMGGYAPTIGIIGTVIGLVHVLENLERAREARPPDRRRVRRHAVGRALGQRHLAADRQPAQARVSEIEAEQMELRHRGHPGDPGRHQPARSSAQKLRAAAAAGSDSRGGLSKKRPEPRRPRHGGRRRKKHEEEEHENHERWLVSYADMMTLLMVLFIVLFAMSQVDQAQVRRSSRQGLSEGFGAPVTILDDGAAVDAPTDVDSPLKPVQVAEEAAVDGPTQTEAEQAAAEAAASPEGPADRGRGHGRLRRAVPAQSSPAGGARRGRQSGAAEFVIDERGLVVHVVVRRGPLRAESADAAGRAARPSWTPWRRRSPRCRTRSGSRATPTSCP